MTCTSCGATSETYRGRCKPCRAAALREWRAKNRDRVKAHSATPAQREAQRQWRVANPEKARSAHRRWKNANRQRVSELQQVRNRALDGDYDRAVIYERDGWVCQLCREEVPRYALPKNDPREPTIDHKVALADGGTDTEDNVQLAHRLCNSKKRPLRLAVAS